MPDEQQPTQPVVQRPSEVFGLTPEEETAYRVTGERLRHILDDARTAIHTVREDENNYGEFLFITVSRVAPQGRAVLTFYGLGYHGYREQWLTDQWFWYVANPSPEVLKQTASRMETEEMLRERERDIEPYLSREEPSPRARLFAMLADLTDEDAAYTELEDLEGLGDDLL